MNFGYQLDPGYIVEHAAALASGFAWTVILTLTAIAGGFILGLAVGAIRSYRIPVLSPVVGVFVEAIRTTPLFVQIFFLYFGLPEIGLTASAFTVANVALIAWGAAYNVENFRAAIDAVPVGTYDATHALGLSRFQAFRLVIAPIATRTAMPSFTNTSVETLKNSALMVAINFPELTDVAINLVAVSFRVFEVFITIAAVYLIATAILTHAMRKVEQRLAWPI